MAEEKQELDVQAPKEPGEVIIELLQQQNKILGALSQSITTELRKIAADTEMAKVYLGKLVKAGPVEVTFQQQGSGSRPESPSFPETPASPIPGG